MEKGHVKFPLLTLAMPAAGAVGVMLWRLRETRRPLTLKRIVIPPVAMSTGFSMFAYAPTRIPLAWALAAFVAGATLFALPLVKSSQLNLVDGQVYLRRSRAFLWVLLGLLVVRTALRETVALYVSPLQTGALFFILAFGMIVHWRIDMVFRFRRLVSHAASAPGQSVLDPGRERVESDSQL